MADKQGVQTTASVLKRQRQNLKSFERNRAYKSALRSQIKSFFKTEQKEQLTASLSLVHKAIDKAQSKGVISRNAAARKKSQTAKFAIQADGAQ